MKFRPIKRLVDEEPSKVITWLRTELNAILRELFIGLDKLSFSDNFQGFEWEGEIAFGQEVQILHNLKLTPSRFLLTQARGTSLIVLGNTLATNEFFYVKNIDTALNFNGKILILP